MKSNEVRKKFLEFFEKRGHSIIPSSSLVPENDPSVLFTTAGMQPLVPYLLGKKHPEGKRLVNIQKCIRTGDIDEIGDNTHLTFFEMMGNWSLGDYFKKEAINWSFELLTDKENGFALDPQRLYVTCFEGDLNAPQDNESYQIWKEIFEKNNVTGERIYFMPAKNNWWQPGPNGPCGPDTEMFYDLSNTHIFGMTKEEYIKADDKQEVVEIWNDVFMEFLKKDDKVVGKLENKNVDTGSGFERVCTVLQGKSNVFETDLFADVINILKQSQYYNEKNARVIADHFRAITFMITDGVIPSNKDQGYTLRRLLRRAIFRMNKFALPHNTSERIIVWYINKYSDTYSDLLKNQNHIIKIFKEELDKFSIALEEGKKKFNEFKKKGKTLTGIDAFILFSSFGMPIEVTLEIAKEENVLIDLKIEEDFKKEFEKHQDLSRVGSEQKFKGGLGDTSQMSIKYHTATHLLHKALREVLGEHVEQKGSNINPERLRFDFSHPTKITEEEKNRINDLVNKKIEENLPVQNIILPKEEALKVGAMHLFGEKYGDNVSVYFIGNDLDSAYSKEFCGGPHVKETGGLGKFRIIKEEAISLGVRRIKAILE